MEVSYSITLRPGAGLNAVLEIYGSQSSLNTIKFHKAPKFSTFIEPPNPALRPCMKAWSVPFDASLLLQLIVLPGLKS